MTEIVKKIIFLFEYKILSKIKLQIFSKIVINIFNKKKTKKKYISNA